MRVIEIIAIIVYVILLAMAIVLLAKFYICDSQSCESFKRAEKKGPKDTQEYVIALNNSLFSEGIWCLPYIAASISTIFVLWFIMDKITVKDFAIMFLVSFAVFYFSLSFFGHHYIKPIAAYTTDWLQEKHLNPEDLEDVMLVPTE